MNQENRRILHIPRRFVRSDWGGTETVILELSKLQKISGWQPEILTSMALADKRSETIEGIAVHRFNHFYPFFGLSAGDIQAMDRKGGNLVSFSLFRRLLAAPNVRLFHAHALKRLGGEVMTAARLRKIPCVLTLHGGVFDVPDSERESMSEASRGKIEWGKLLGAILRSRRLLEDADHVICVGESELALAREKLGHNRISFLPNGVNPEKFRAVSGSTFRSRHGIPNHAFLVSTIGRIDAQKNQLLLVESFAQLRKSLPDARLLLMGPVTQPAYAERLHHAVDRLGMGGSVLIINGVNNDDPELVEAYQASDVLCLPSKHEPFGIVVLEAWSCGKPVVASRVGGLQSLVRDGETGLLFDPNAADAGPRLAANLKGLADNPGLCNSLGTRGRSEIEARYTWQRISERLENIYRSAEEHVRSRTNGANSVKSGASDMKGQPAVSRDGDTSR